MLLWKAITITIVTATCTARCYQYYHYYRNKSRTAVGRRSGVEAACARLARDGLRGRPPIESVWRPPRVSSRRRATRPGKRCRTCRRPTLWRTWFGTRRRRSSRRFRSPSPRWRRRETGTPADRRLDREQWRRQIERETVSFNGYEWREHRKTL